LIQFFKSLLGLLLAVYHQGYGGVILRPGSANAYELSKTSQGESALWAHRPGQPLRQVRRRLPAVVGAGRKPFGQPPAHVHAVAGQHLHHLYRRGHFDQTARLRQIKRRLMGHRQRFNRYRSRQQTDRQLLQAPFRALFRPSLAAQPSLASFHCLYQLDLLAQYHFAALVSPLRHL